MTPQEWLDVIAARGGRLYLEAGRLVVEPAEAVTDAEAAELAAHRGALLSLLATAPSAPAEPPPETQPGETPAETFRRVVWALFELRADQADGLTVSRPAVAALRQRRLALLDTLGPCWAEALERAEARRFRGERGRCGRCGRLGHDGPCESADAGAAR